ncbi:MAG: tetratricopeptide repeat protein, partial [bacterium]|nr:tetratricopeptide repeat protein [bacterium]
PAGILVHGLGGVGKTTLARGFVEWLARTEGLGAGCFWIAFQEVRSAEYVFNRMGEQLFGTQFAVLDAERKIAELARVLRDNRYVIVWDNFEVVAGIAGSSARPTLSEEDRGQLRAFLAALRDGWTKVLITSRSEEDWLKPERWIVSLSGLRGEERWVYCEEILGDLGLTVDRKDPEVTKLMELLDGHPLAMRVLLPELEKRRAGELIGALQANLAALDLDADEASAKLYATLGFAEEALDAGLRPLLVPLSFHERFADGDHLEAMARRFEPSPSRGEIDALLRALTSAGLLRVLGQGGFEMHPALTGFLRSALLRRTLGGVRDRWARAFVDLFGSLASQLAPRPFHEQRTAIRLHGANFLVALEEAERLGMTDDRAFLLQVLGTFAQNQHSFVEAEQQYRKLADFLRERGEVAREAVAYHQLGIIAEERRDFDAAEKWHEKSLKIKEKLGDEHGAASTYHQLGRIARERWDFDSAEKWHRESLKINEKLSNEHDAAITYHQLGII